MLADEVNFSIQIAAAVTQTAAFLFSILRTIGNELDFGNRRCDFGTV
jgi:hypothetical protein